MSFLESSFSPVADSLVVAIVAECIKSIVLISVMDVLVADKPDIGELERVSSWTLPLIGYTVMADTVKVAFQRTIVDLAPPTVLMSGTDVLSVLSVLIIRPFMFEVVFDLVHYWAHRGMHTIGPLYRRVHKVHHRYQRPSAYTTFVMHPVDVALSSGVPLMISALIVRPSAYELVLWCNYLRYQEIGGHLGKRMSPTSSFPQFVWLPRWLGIELYTEDHDLHHALTSCNYSKRFVIWDRVFGTFVAVPTSRHQRANEVVSDDVEERE